LTKRSLELRACDVPRIPLLGTSENRGRPFTTGPRYRHLIKNDAICLVLVLS
jgi:hypothetical protein